MPSLVRASVLALLPLLAAACASTVDQTTGATGAGGGTHATSSSTGNGGATSTGTTTSTSGPTASSSSSSTGSTSSGDGALGTPSSTYPAPFPTPPQVQDFGGPVLASPKIVPVFFAGDDAATVAQIEDFDAKVGATMYWAATVSEYGVGAAVGLPPVVLTETAPANIDDSGIQTWLAGKLNGNDPAWPAADANTVYVLHYPQGTTITIGGGQAASCQTFGGYHDNITLDANHGSADVAYAVLPRCQSFGGMSLIQAETSSESHELIEAATDPFPSTNPAYADVDQLDSVWSLTLGGGEIGDMCAQWDGVFTQFPELAYTVQRTWSNKAAKAGDDPCVPPLAGEVYFNAAPELPDHTNLSFMGQTATVRSVQIPVGKSKTIDLDLFSNASTNGPFSVHVDDFDAIMGGTAHLSFSVGSTATIPCPPMSPAGSICVGGENGQKIPLTITVTSANQSNAEAFWVVSSLPGDANQNIWVGLVTN